MEAKQRIHIPTMLRDDRPSTPRAYDWKQTSLNYWGQPPEKYANIGAYKAAIVTNHRLGTKNRAKMLKEP